MDDWGTDRRDEHLQILSRDELEERVRQRTSELENVTDAMVDILIRLDEKGTISMINDAVRNILGYEPAELEGKPIDILLTDSPAEGQSPVSSVNQLLERLLGEGQVTDMEVYCSTADGERLPMSLSASILEDENGVPTGIVCVAKDISERKAAEEQAEFLHSLLRHDLENRLQVAMGYLEILGDSTLAESDRQYVDRSLDAVTDATELIENVRKLDRIEDAESLQSVHLTTAVTDAVDGYEKLRTEKGVETETDLDDVSVLAGPLLVELFNNLVENSLVHSNADRLRLTTTVDEETVTVTVEDDGDGIPPENQDVIFERGHSGGGSSGSGLGMYIVGELVENYGGEVNVTESSLGGARFDVTLQLTPE